MSNKPDCLIFLGIMYHGNQSYFNCTMVLHVNWFTTANYMIQIQGMKTNIKGTGSQQYIVPEYDIIAELYIILKLLRS